VVRVPIRRVDPTLSLPSYATPGATGFDLAARTTVTIEPGETKRVPANVVIGVPDGFALVIALRSSTPQRKGLIIPNGVGIIDQDYRGSDDEIQILVYNIGSLPATVERGERIAQGLLVPVERVDWDATNELGTPSRGGFGSTG